MLDYLEGDQTLDDFLDDFPTVTREATVRALRSPAMDESHFLETVDAGLASADRGEFVEQEEIRTRLKQILKS